MYHKKQEGKNLKGKLLESDTAAGFDKNDQIQQANSISIDLKSPTTAQTENDLVSKEKDIQLDLQDEWGNKKGWVTRSVCIQVF